MNREWILSKATTDVRLVDKGCYLRNWLEAEAREA